MAGEVALTLSAQTAGLLADLRDFFPARGVEAYLVGGSLRDALLGRDSRDIDLAVTADPLALGPQLADALSGHFFALAEGQHAARIVLPEAGIHVDLLPLGDGIEANLRERDFTIDALAARLEEAASGRATVIDPSGGRNDLRRRLVRVIGEEAFVADPLRPLRGVRLAVELGFRIEPATADLVRRHAPRLREAAPERQRDELMRILAAPGAGQGLRLLDELGLLDQLLPEVTACRGEEQPKEHHWDVLGHSLAAVEALDALLSEEEPRAASLRQAQGRPWRRLWRELWGELAWWEGARPYFREEVVPERPRRAVIKLAALLHDIAKPETRSFDETGRMRFFGHGDIGAEKAGRILRRLRFSAREVVLVQAMVKAHLRPVQMGQQGPPTRRALYRYFRDCGDAAIDTLFLSLADHLATVGPRVRQQGWRAHVALVNYIVASRLREEELVAPAKLLRGDELMAELRLSPGPLVGRLLETVREAQAAGEIRSREEALALARSALRRERLGAGEREAQ